MANPNIQTKFKIAMDKAAAGVDQRSTELREIVRQKAALAKKMTDVLDGKYNEQTPSEEHTHTRRNSLK